MRLFRITRKIWSSLGIDERIAAKLGKFPPGKMCFFKIVYGY